MESIAAQSSSELEMMKVMRIDEVRSCQWEPPSMGSVKCNFNSSYFWAKSIRFVEKLQKTRI